MTPETLTLEVAQRLLTAALEPCRTCAGAKYLCHTGKKIKDDTCPDCRDSEGNPTGKRLPLVLERCNFGHSQTCFNLAQHDLLSRIIDHAERLGVRECVLNTNYPGLDYYARLGDSEANSATVLDAAAEALLLLVEGK